MILVKFVRLTLKLRVCVFEAEDVSICDNVISRAPYDIFLYFFLLDFLGLDFWKRLFLSRFVVPKSRKWRVVFSIWTVGAWQLV